MNAALVLFHSLIFLLVAFAGTVASAAPARIENTFPPVQERRGPDLVVEHEGGPPALLVYAPDGRTVASAGRAGKAPVVRLFNARTGAEATGELLRTFNGTGAGPLAAIGFRGPNELWAVGRDGVLDRFEVATAKLLGSARLPAAPTAVALSPGERPLLAFVADGVQIYDQQAGKVIFSHPVGKSHPVGCLAFRADGKLLAFAVDDALTLLEVPTGKVVRTLAGGAAVRSCAVTATHLAAGIGSGAKLWSLVAEESPRILSEQRPPVTVAFSSKGDQVVTAGKHRTFAVWDVPSGALLASYEGHTRDVTAVAFNPNGQKLASGSADGRLGLWTVPLPPLPAVDREKIDAAIPEKAAVTPKKKRQVLVFWRADAILHKGGVPAVNRALERMGKKTGAFEAFFSRDYEVFDPRVLSRFDALVFNSTAHISLPDDAKKKALLDWVAAGHGVVGVHAAIDMWKRWPEGAAVIGATFAGHPWSPRGSWSVKLEEPGHPLVRALRGKAVNNVFKMKDEFYELGEPYSRKDRRVLLSLDVRDPATANVTPLHRSDRDFAVSWVKRHGEGRIFYAMFGHIADPFHDPAVQQFYLDGIQYALGDLPAESAPRP